MKKQLLTLLSLVAIATYGQENGKRNAGKMITTHLEENQKVGLKSASTPTTILVSPFTGTQVSVFAAGSDSSTPGCSPNAGYVFGSNCYGDLEKAQYFAASSYSSSVTNASVVSCIAYLYKSGTKGTGGTNSVNVSLNIYSGTSNMSAPGTLISQGTASMGAILAAYTGSANIFTYTFSITPPATVSAGFYASISTPDTPGDTIVVVNQTASVNNAWEEWSDNSWHSCSSAWGSGVSGNIGLFPVISGDLVTSVFNSDWFNILQVFPNPTSDYLVLHLSANDVRDVKISLTNILGQEVLSKNWDVQWFGEKILDLTSVSSGMYFLTLEHNGKKHTEKIIVKH